MIDPHTPLTQADLDRIHDEITAQGFYDEREVVRSERSIVMDRICVALCVAAAVYFRGSIRAGAAVNAAQLRAQGIERVVHVPAGPLLSRGEWHAWNEHYSCPEEMCGIGATSEAAIADAVARRTRRGA